MKKKDANIIIYNALNVAILKGCYNLDDSIKIVDALRLILLEENN